jgi:hypothetical protein
MTTNDGVEPKRTEAKPTPTQNPNGSEKPKPGG